MESPSCWHLFRSCNSDSSALSAICCQYPFCTAFWYVLTVDILPHGQHSKMKNIMRAHACILLGAFPLRLLVLVMPVPPRYWTRPCIVEIAFCFPPWSLEILLKEWYNRGDGPNYGMVVMVLSSWCIIKRVQVAGLVFMLRHGFSTHIHTAWHLKTPKCRTRESLFSRRLSVLNYSLQAPLWLAKLKRPSFGLSVERPE